MPKAKRGGVPVTTRAVIARINRALKPDDQMLKITRGARAQVDLGRYYVLNYMRNLIVKHHVDPETVARKLGVLKDYEEVIDDEADER
jgi:hypothetical protein